MYNYQMRIVNSDNCEKIVYVSGDTYMEAVANMRKEYGKEWVVYSSKLVSANC